MRCASVFLLALLASVLLTESVDAQRRRRRERRREARTARLGLLNTTERRQLAPLLDEGPLALIEFTGDSELPAVILAARVNAPARDVIATLANPGRYTDYMPGLAEVDVEETEREGFVAFDWTWRTAVFMLRGRNVMTVYPDPIEAGRRDRPHKVAITSIAGDLGSGRWVFRAYDDAERGGCLLVISSRIDMREANYISRELGGRSSVNRSINIALATVMLLGTKHESERLAGNTVPTPATMGPLERPDIDLETIAPLLNRGDVVISRPHGRGFSQVGVVGRMGKPDAEVRAILSQPESFGGSLLPGSFVEIVENNPGEVVFDWGISMPLIGSSGRMRAHISDTVVGFEGVSGNLSEGQWLFDTHAFRWNEVALIGWSRFEPGDSSWLVETVTSDNPYFSYGLAMASEVMLVRAIRSRVHREARRRRREARQERRRARLRAMGIEVDDEEGASGSADDEANQDNIQLR